MPYLKRFVRRNPTPYNSFESPPEISQESQISDSRCSQSLISTLFQCIQFSQGWQAGDMIGTLYWQLRLGSLLLQKCWKEPYWFLIYTTFSFTFFSQTVTLLHFSYLAFAPRGEKNEIDCNALTRYSSSSNHSWSCQKCPRWEMPPVSKYLPDLGETSLSTLTPANIQKCCFGIYWEMMTSQRINLEIP